MPSRRRFLALAGGATVATLAGCTSTSPDSPPPSDPQTIADPDRRLFAATGEWSTFGANAANNRVVDDGQAPVDGVAERWRVDAGYATLEPLVDGDVVYVPSWSGTLRALDAEDGSERWSLSDTAGYPVVRDDTLYTGVSDGLLAVDADDGTERWRRSLDGDGSATVATMPASDWLLAARGETLSRVETGEGAVRWSRRLVGPVVGAATYPTRLAAVATEAGKLYLLGADGTAYGEVTLPSRPRTPPVAGSDGVYANCLDGRTYGVVLERPPRNDVDWSVETGWAEAGMAVHDDLYVAGTQGLTAIDPDSGEKRWSESTGTDGDTAPVLGRDTLFVGGDALYAFDPTPESGLLDGGGPALRFSESFHGGVGPGPVVDDGRLYAVVETAEETHELLAFDPA
jgi:outer membrane protein assembly factor BamB